MKISSASDPTEWIKKGKAAEHLKEYEDAITSYNKAIEIDPSNEGAFISKGYCLLVLKKYQDTVECCDKAITINPEQVISHLLKMPALFKLGKHEESYATYNKVKDLDPKYFATWEYKGQVLGGFETFEEAITHYYTPLERKLLTPTDSQSLEPEKVREYFERYKVDTLYYMCPIEHLFSILEHGILSREYAKKYNLIVREIGSANIIEKNRWLWEYARLYFAFNTPMQYRIIKGDVDGKYTQIDENDLIFLLVDPFRVFTIPGIFITDGNAANAETRKSQRLGFLQELDWELIHYEPAYSHEQVRKKMAEVLVPNNVPPECIKCVSVNNQTAIDNIKNKYGADPLYAQWVDKIRIDPSLY